MSIINLLSIHKVAANSTTFYEVKNYANCVMSIRRARIASAPALPARDAPVCLHTSITILRNHYK